MPRKLLVIGVVAIAMFYLVSSPTAAAGAVKSMGVGMQHVMHQVAVFLKSV